MYVYLHHIMVSIVKISNQSQSQSILLISSLLVFIYIYSFPVSTGQAALKYTDPLDRLYMMSSLIVTNI